MVTSPRYCEKHETLQEVAEQMSESNIGSLPVVDEDKKPIGIITDRDICITVASNAHKPLSEIKVEEIINKRKIFTCSTEDNIQTALKIMRTKQVGRLPVVDTEQKLKGIVSLHTIVRKTPNNEEKMELEYKGEENIFKTLHSLASRRTELVF